MKKHARVLIPATSANLGPGFDVLGVALRLHNEVRMEAEFDPSPSHEVNGRRGLQSVSIDVVGEGLDTLPRDESNLVARAAARVFEAAKRWPKVLNIQLINRIPLSRGLGSSAAATVGGMYAAHRLCGRSLPEADLLDMAVEMEGHADNIVPAVMGGFCISGQMEGKTKHVKFNAPVDLRAVVCVPQKPLPTREARRVLPSRIPFTAAVFTSSHVAFLLGALLKKRYADLGFAMEDVLHQPARAALIPGLAKVIAEARKAGAWGSALSGAGSSVIALCKPGVVSKRVGQAMVKSFASHGIQSRWLELPLENTGIRIS